VATIGRGGAYTHHVKAVVIRLEGKESRAVFLYHGRECKGIGRGNQETSRLWADGQKKSLGNYKNFGSKQLGDFLKKIGAKEGRSEKKKRGWLEDYE